MPDQQIIRVGDDSAYNGAGATTILTQRITPTIFVGQEFDSKNPTRYNSWLGIFDSVRIPARARVKHASLKFTFDASRTTTDVNWRLHLGARDGAWDARGSSIRDPFIRAAFDVRDTASVSMAPAYGAVLSVPNAAFFTSRSVIDENAGEEQLTRLVQYWTPTNVRNGTIERIRWGLNRSATPVPSGTILTSEVWTLEGDDPVAGVLETRISSGTLDLGGMSGAALVLANVVMTPATLTVGKPYAFTASISPSPARPGDFIAVRRNQVGNAESPLAVDDTLRNSKFLGDPDAAEQLNDDLLAFTIPSYSTSAGSPGPNFGDDDTLRAEKIFVSGPAVSGVGAFVLDDSIVFKDAESPATGDVVIEYPLTAMLQQWVDDPSYRRTERVLVQWAAEGADVSAVDQIVSVYSIEGDPALAAELTICYEVWTEPAPDPATSWGAQDGSPADDFSRLDTSLYGDPSKVDADPSRIPDDPSTMGGSRTVYRTPCWPWDADPSEVPEDPSTLTKAAPPLPTWDPKVCPTATWTRQEPEDDC